MNNEIVLMRHAVRKARVVVISKLVKEIKHLNGRKHGDKNVIEKCKRKAERLIREIKVLKTIKNDTLSKFAITNTRDLKEVLADTHAGIRTRIMTRLAFSKALKDKVEKFRKTFPDYLNLLNQNKMKEKKKTKLDETVKNEENTMDTSETIEKDVSENGSIVDTEEDSCDSDVDHQNEDQKEPESNQVAVSETQNKTKKKTEKTVKCQPKISTPITMNSKSKKNPTVKVVSKLATVMRFNVADDVMENIGAKEAIPDEAESKEEITKVDQEPNLFSSTASDDDNYLCLTKPPPLPKSYDTKKDNFNYNLSKNQYSNRNFFTNIDDKSKRTSNISRNDINSRNKFSRSINNHTQNSKNTRENYNRVENSKKQAVKTNNNANNEDLHPSWAARKKEQEILKQGFQGKKIVFNDD
ncbi:hypothetical protein PV327_003972 [Microctonus hyperodae]|uniref:Serum response factor-binding protein 1 n=1 Tax=Microctonus hyperodae TaxID=165561 RepID=A0AA39G538_MICHY|nr:hypothetical protein PV327_003972 [Microctonus hyperodae]